MRTEAGRDRSRADEKREKVSALPLQARLPGTSEDKALGGKALEAVNLVTLPTTCPLKPFLMSPFPERTVRNKRSVRFPLKIPRPHIKSRLMGRTLCRRSNRRRSRPIIQIRRAICVAGAICIAGAVGF